MSKRHIISQKGSEPPDKICKVKIPKNPKDCSYCDFDITEPCQECRNNTHILLQNPCPSRECSLSTCDEDFHLHCYQSCVREFNGQIDALNCLYC